MKNILAFFVFVFVSPCYGLCNLNEVHKIVTAPPPKKKSMAALLKMLNSVFNLNFDAGHVDFIYLFFFLLTDISSHFRLIGNLHLRVYTVCTYMCALCVWRAIELIVLVSHTLPCSLLSIVYMSNTSLWIGVSPTVSLKKSPSTVAARTVLRPGRRRRSLPKRVGWRGRRVRM